MSALSLVTQFENTSSNIISNPFYYDGNINFGYGINLTVLAAAILRNPPPSQLQPSTQQQQNPVGLLLSNAGINLTVAQWQSIASATPATAPTVAAQLSSELSSIAPSATNVVALAGTVAQAYITNVVVPALSNNITDFSALPSGTQAALEDAYYNGPGLLGKLVYKAATNGNLTQVAIQLAFNEQAPDANASGAELRNLARAVIALGGTPTFSPDNTIASIDWSAADVSNVVLFLSQIVAAAPIGQNGSSAANYVTGWGSSATNSFSTITASLYTYIESQGEYVINSGEATYGSILANNSSVGNFNGVIASDLAALNGTSVSALLTAGQIIDIPASVTQGLPASLSSSLSYTFDVATGRTIATAVTDGLFGGSISIQNSTTGAFLGYFDAGTVSGETAGSSGQWTFALAGGQSVTFNADGSLSTNSGTGQSASFGAGASVDVSADGNSTVQSSPGGAFSPLFVPATNAYDGDLSIINAGNSAGLPTDISALMGIEEPMEEDIDALNYLSERIANGFVSDKYVAAFIGPAPGSTFSLADELLSSTYDPAAAGLRELENAAVGGPGNWIISVEVEGFSAAAVVPGGSLNALTSDIESSPGSTEFTATTDSPAAGTQAVTAYVDKGYAAAAASSAEAIASALAGEPTNFDAQIDAIESWYGTTRILGAGSGSTIGVTAGSPDEIAAYGSAPMAGAEIWQTGQYAYLFHSTAPADTIQALDNIAAITSAAVSTATAVATGANAIMSAQIAAEQADTSNSNTDIVEAQNLALTANQELGGAIAEYLAAAQQVAAMSTELSNVSAELAVLEPVSYEATGNLANGYSYFSAGDAAFAADTFAGFAAGMQTFAATKDGLDRTLSAIAQASDAAQVFVGQNGVSTALANDNDLFIAGSGNETVVDGEGQDVILLSPGSGNLAVDNFKVGIDGDQLQFLDVGTSLIVSDDGHGGTFLTYGSGTTVDLINVAPDSLNLFQNITGVSTVSFAGVAEAGSLSTGGNRLYDGQVHITSISGSNAGDTLSGDSAATTLMGGSGNDTFDVNGIDYVMNGGGGINTVSYVNVPLGVQVNLETGLDNLGSTLFDIQNVEGTAYDDTITGDANNNILDGNGGDDTLVGGGGNDTYMFNIGYGQDVIENGIAANGIPSGELLLGAGIDANDLWLTQSGSDLVIQILGTDSQVTVQGWFTNSWQQLESIALSNGLEISPQTVATLVELQSLYVAANPGFDPQTAQTMPGGIDLTDYFGPPSNPTTVPVATNVALTTEHQYDGGYATQGANTASSWVSAIDGQVSAVTGANNNAYAWAVSGKALPPPYGAGENYAYEYTESGSSLTFVGLYTTAFGSGIPGSLNGITSYTQISSLVPTTFYIKEMVTVSPVSSSNPSVTTAYEGDPNVMDNVINDVSEANSLIATAATLAQAVANTDTAEQTALGAAVAANSEGASFDSQAAALDRSDALNAEADLAATIADWVPTENNLQSATGILQSSQAALNGVLPATQVVTQLDGKTLVTYTTTYSFYTSTDQNQFNALQADQTAAQSALNVANGEFNSLVAALQGFGPYADAQIAGPSANLNADSGGDLLIAAGAGYHVLTGGAGRDTFAFGSWNDTSTATVENFQTGTQGDRLLIVPAVNRTVYITDSGSTTDVSFYVSSGAVDTVALTGVSLNTLSLYDNFEGVDTADFADETHSVVIDLESVTPRSYDGSTHIQNLIGSNYGDTLIGDEQDNTITGGAGNDTLSGGAGNNVLNGGGGVNTVSYAGNPAGVTVNLATDTAINGYGGTDTLANIQNVIGSAGNDTIFGDTSNNRLDGGGGNDTMVGDGGDDTYVFGAGYGQDVIVNGIAGSTTPSGQLDLGAGLSTANLWFAQSGYDLIIQVVGTTDQMTVQGWFSSDASYRQLTSIVLADGTQLNTAAVNSLVIALAAAAPGFNPATATTLSPAAAAVAGEYWTTTIAGTAGNDTLMADGANDTLVGDGGSDNYVVNSGDYRETIVNGLSSATAPSGKLVLGAGLTPDNLWFTQSGNDLVIQILGTNDQITVQGWFANAYSQLQGVTLADGSTISSSAITALAAAMDVYQQGNPEFDAQTASQLPVDSTLSAALNTGWSRVITGTAANDVLSGYQGADILDGGTGNDTLTGGAGQATYLFNAGYGQDVIINGMASNAGPSGELALGAGLSGGNLWFSESGNDLVIQELGTMSQVTIKGWFANSYNQIAFIVAGGVTLSAQAATELAQTMTAWQDANPSFSAQSATTMPTAVQSAIATAWPSGMTSIGTTGNDVLDPAGQSNDTLVGDGGIDTYRFDIVEGTETIINGSSGGTQALGQLVLGEGLNPDNLWFRQSGSDLVIQELGTTNAVTVKGWFTSTASQFAYLTLSDGSQITNASVSALIVAMAAYQSADPAFNPATSSQQPVDSSAAGQALQQALASDWVRTIVGAPGETVSGGQGIDQIYVGEGSETIIAAPGGSSTYFFGADTEFWQTTIINANNQGKAAVGQIRMPTGISPSELWFTQVGSDLHIQLLGTTNEIIVENWYAGAAAQTVYTLGGLVVLTTAEVNAMAVAMTAYQNANPQFNPQTASSQPQDAAISAAFSTYIPSVIIGTPGNDTLSVTQTNETEIDPGTGNDVESGNDTYYILNRGYGQDQITNTAGARDGYLALGVGLGASNLWFTQSGNDLRIQVLGTQTQVLIKNWFVGTSSQLTGIELDNGSTISAAQISALAAAMTTYQNVNPGYNAQIATELPNNSAIQAAIDADWARTVTLLDGAIADAGPGNSILDGEKQYVFDVGYGQQTIERSSPVGLPGGTLILDPDASIDQIWFSKSGQNLVMQYLGTSDSVTVQNWFSTTADQLQTIVLGGQQLTTAGVNALETVMSAYQVANPSFSVATATGLPSTLQATITNTWSAAPIVSGTSGNDSLDGSDGSETLVGNGGTDTYLFGRGDSVEQIVNGVASSNVAAGELMLGTGITDTNVWLDRVDSAGNVSASGANLRLDLLGTKDSVTIVNWFTGGANYAQLNDVVLSDSGLKLDTQINTLVQAMASFEASFGLNNGGAVFDPTNPSNAVMTDPTVLAAVNSAWHH